MSDSKIECEIRRKENMKLCKRIDRLNADIDKLKEFARWVIREGWNGDVYGAQIQEKGESMGLLYLDTVKESDLDSGYDYNDIGEATIYRFTDILKEEKR